jgi:hypothetical protein
MIIHVHFAVLLVFSKAFESSIIFQLIRIKNKKLNKHHLLIKTLSFQL